MIRNKLAAITLVGFAALVSAPFAHAADLKVGVSAGPYGDIMKFAGDLAAKEGINVQVIEFSDYTLPNTALAQKDIDFNNFQHKPYLENQVAQRGWDLVPVAPSIIVPMAIYSKKISSFDELRDGAQVTIPNDPSNGARGLQLLEKAGLIKLDPKAGTNATVMDIVENPKKLRIREVDAAQLPRSLDDVDIAVCTLNYAMSSGLNPNTSLLSEGADSEWGLWFVTRGDNKDDPAIRRYIEIYRSPEVKEFIMEKFEGTIVTSW
ncbi:MetQ/NlpA family ABC transporter substrate-binding protein [Telmatospirillum sp. J64-1]|uniref:MetQ/NlpA family ABC transporter substrate-binding protein n=1 Tax=Telmatospirillum sp. J64-1 TaxID=2502183 RepID=UPI00115DC25C|nr:MetQ/NlpA family ABC transporter substrate-binding protein [Telmatospirillum sp. J64-1]